MNNAPSNPVPRLPAIYLARHGETEWTLAHRHTGLTDLPLTPRGQLNARRLGERLQSLTFARVFTSPLERAAATCRLAGRSVNAITDPDLVEWNYGSYEGLTGPEILTLQPGWELFRDGCPGGESLSDVALRAQRVIARLRALNDDLLLFSSSHFLRVLTACWLNLDPAGARCFVLDTAAVSILTYEHDLHHPVIQLWNDRHHAID